MQTDDQGKQALTTELVRTPTDERGPQPRDLQNCLRGAVEASRVSSILIHPRQIQAS